VNRREFLQCAAVLVSGATAGQLGFALNQEQQIYLAAAPNYNSNDVNLFTGPQRELVSAIAECILPRTDTPGAVDAGVPRFIELMVADWLNEQERSTFFAGLADLQKRIPGDYGKPFAQLDTAEQIEVLEALEKEASDSPWYEFGNVLREFISDAPFICQIKELTVWGFFTSEVGSTQVLRYEAMPMRFEGDTPLSPDESTWATMSI